MTGTTATRSAEEPFALRPDRWETLERRAEQAAALADRDGAPAIAAVTVAIDPELDLSAAVLAARTAADRWFCIEQPDRDGYGVWGLGEAAAVTAAGEERFAVVSRSCREMARRVVADDPSEDRDRPAGTGPVWLGGFAFAADGGQAPEWSTLAPAQLVMPELAFARGGGAARMTVAVELRPGGSAAAAVERARARVASLRPATMPLLDPDPAVKPRVATAAPPSHYEDAVARAVERIRSGEFEKIVLAREVRVHAAEKIDPGTLIEPLRWAFPACYCYCVGTPELAFVGASPELLVRRDGERAQTVALAGTTRRSADPAVDGHLGEQLLSSAKDRGEQQIVTQRIERTLAPKSLWVTSADAPSLVKVQNVQHLATPIRAQLAEPVATVELAGMLHPTPAVGGEPGEAAIPVIPALEGLDRGWYSGAVGWTDLAEDGEFCVALRCALVCGEVAHLYAGCGVVGDSVPADELAETEVKLQAMLPLFA